MKQGIERISTETGAGQWGSAISYACSLYDIECKVYMVRASYDQKPYRKSLMNTWGATCVASPSMDTVSGRMMLEKDPNMGGSLGLAISEAVEDAATHDNTNYTLGSVLNHVCTHQSIIGQEVIEQFKQIDTQPDVVIGCVGGGSNFAGIAFPYYHQKITGKNPDVEIIGAEPMACPTLTKGLYEYDYGDVAGLTPIMKMFTLGHDFMPPSIHAGGLRYHGDSPLVCKLVKEGYINARAYHQTECIAAAVAFARTEGHVIAPESSHALKCAMDEALRCRQTGEEKVIVFNNSGHGNFDLTAYDSYFNGTMVDYEYPEELIMQSLAKLPKVD
jgi:tryptophan synthase beta chain